MIWEIAQVKVVNRGIILQVMNIVMNGNMTDYIENGDRLYRWDEIVWLY